MIRITQKLSKVLTFKIIYENFNIQIEVYHPSPFHFKNYILIYNTIKVSTFLKKYRNNPKSFLIIF